MKFEKRDARAFVAFGKVALESILIWWDIYPFPYVRLRAMRLNFFILVSNSKLFIFLRYGINFISLLYRDVHYAVSICNNFCRWFDINCDPFLFSMVRVHFFFIASLLVCKRSIFSLIKLTIFSVLFQLTITDVRYNCQNVNCPAGHTWVCRNIQKMSRINYNCMRKVTLIWGKLQRSIA